MPILPDQLAARDEINILKSIIGPGQWIGTDRITLILEGKEGFPSP